jgi:uncharacterized protein involved in exopolysaccharide biosynthesis
MIDPDGKLTAKGRNKCDTFLRGPMKTESGKAAASELFEANQPGASKDKWADKLMASDWAVLMKYDRNTGNLLTYDPETGELDQTSRAILQNPSLIQRLIDNNVILPGGWLTPEAKHKCIHIEEKLKRQPADGYSDLKDHPNLNPERLSKVELQSNGEHLAKEDKKVSGHNDPGFNDQPKAKTDAGPERLPDKLSKIRSRDKDQAEPAEPEDDKPEAAISKVSPSCAIQHYPDMKDKLQEKTESKPADIRGPAPKTGAKRNILADQDLQAFFENLSYDQPALDPESTPKPSHEQQSNGELLLKSEHLSKDEKQKKFYPELGNEKNGGKSQEVIRPEGSPIKETASIRKLRKVDLDTLSKSEDNYEERPKRRKKGSGGGGRENTEPPRLSLRDFFHILFKRKFQIILCFFFVVSMATVATFMMNPVYEASTQILVKLGRESVFVPTSGNVTPILNINREEQVNSEIEILKSRSLAEKVVAAIGPTVIYKSLAEKKSGIRGLIFPDKRSDMTPREIKEANFESAVAVFMKALAVTGIKSSNVIKVSFKHQDPLMAAMVVNNLSNMFLDHHLAVHKRPQNVKFFQHQSNLLKSKLEKAEEKLKALKKQHNITSLEEQRSLLLGRSSTLKSALNQTISEEVETEKRIRLLGKQLASVPETVSQGMETEQNPYLINTLEARLVELQLKEKELLNKYTDESRLVQNVKEEIRVVEQKLKEQETKRYGSRTSGINPTHQRLKEELFRNEAELEALKAKKITQQNHIFEIQDKLEKFNQIELEIKQLEQEIKVDQENYRIYLTKVEESRISDAMDSEKIASVSLIGPARPPTKPVSPKVMLNILLSIFLGIMGSLSLALFREYLDDRIENIEDVENELQLPVLASIPIFEQKSAGAGKF